MRKWSNGVLNYTGILLFPLLHLSTYLLPFTLLTLNPPVEDAAHGGEAESPEPLSFVIYIPYHGAAHPLKRAKYG